MSDTIPQTVLNKVRQDKFVLVIDTPKILKDWETKSARTKDLVNRDKMEFSIIAVNLPQHAVPAVGVPYRGQTPHVTSQTREEYPVSKVQFTIDNNFDNYWFLWKWLYIINHPREGGMDSYFAQFKNVRNSELDSLRDVANNQIKKSSLPPVKYKEIKMVNDYYAYQTTMTLYGLREYNEKIVKFDYYNSFITALGEINYDYRATEEIGCSFDFSYGQIDIDLIDPI